MMEISHLKAPDRVSKIPDRIPLEIYDELPELDFTKEYVDALTARNSVVCCPNTVTASEVVHYVHERPDGELRVRTKIRLSDTGWYILNHYTATYLGLAKLFFEHRGRTSTIASSKTQIYELENILPERLTLQIEKKRQLNEKYVARKLDKPLTMVYHKPYKKKEEEKIYYKRIEKEYGGGIKDAILHVLYRKLWGLQREINVAYNTREASVFSGLLWTAVAQSQVLTDLLYKLTKQYLETLIYAIETGKYAVLMKAYNLAIRARNVAVMAVKDIMLIGNHDYRAIEEILRSRLAFFYPGPSSVNALQKGKTSEDIKQHNQKVFVEMVKIIGLPLRQFRSLYTDRGALYMNVNNQLKKGKYLACFDGKAHEATTAVVVGKPGSGFATYIKGNALFTSGNFITSPLNTAVVGIIDDDAGIFEQGFICWGAGDDNTILIDDPKQLAALIKLFPAFMEFQPVDTLAQYILGFTMLDVPHPHAMGGKATKDAAGFYEPMKLTDWDVTDPKNFEREQHAEMNSFNRKFSLDEHYSYRRIYSNVISLLPYMDEVFSDLDYFSPRWMRDRMPKWLANRRDRDRILVPNPGPIRDTQHIMDRYMEIWNGIPDEFEEKNFMEV